MSNTAYTQEDLQRLDRNIANGILNLRTSDGRRIEYKSTEDQLKARAHMQAQLDAANRTNPLRRVRRYFTRTGH
jgi:roadblock/LC7 domain-containing protein